MPVAVPRPVALPAPGVVMPGATVAGLFVVSHPATAKPTKTKIDKKIDFIRCD